MKSLHLYGLVAILGVSAALVLRAPFSQEGSEHAPAPTGGDGASVLAEADLLEQDREQVSIGESSGQGQPAPNDALTHADTVDAVASPWEDVRAEVQRLFVRSEDDRQDHVYWALQWPIEAGPQPTFAESYFNPSEKVLSNEIVAEIMALITPTEEALTKLGSDSFDFFCVAMDDYVRKEKFAKALGKFPDPPPVPKDDESLWRAGTSLFCQGWYMRASFRSSEYPEFQTHLQNIVYLKQERDEMVRSYIASL